MQTLDPELTSSVHHGLRDLREDLFDVAEQAKRLDARRGSTDVNGLLQQANYTLGEAQRELASLS